MITVLRIQMQYRKLDQYLIFPKDLLNLKPQKNEVRDNKLFNILWKN